jgi:hypothetical protein
VSDRRLSADSSECGDDLADEAVSGQTLYDTPVFRRGLVVRAVRTVNQEREPVRRNAAEAQQLGQLIAASLDGYLSAINAAFKDIAQKRTVELKPPSELTDQITRARYAPGLIIDFPAHEATIGDFTIRERTCITVCQDDDASKIWTRLLLVEPGGTAVTSERAGAFFKLCDELADEIISRIRDKYLTNFLAQQINNTGQSIAFDDIGVLDFFGCDISSLHLTNEDADRAQYSEAQRQNHIELLKRQFSPIVHSIFNEPSTMKNFNLSTSSDIMYCYGGSPKPVLYVALFEPRRAVFLVLSEPGDARTISAPKKSDIYRPSGALSAMSTLASAVGREF